MCINYHELNKVMIKNKYLLLRIDDLKGATVFLKMNLWSGHYQLKVHESGIPKTALWTHYRHYEFLVMSYGLVNAPAVFVDLINRVFEWYVNKLVIVLLMTFQYIRVWWRSIRYIRSSYRGKLREKRLYTEFLTCEFWLKKVACLGHVVSEEGISVDSSKIEAVSQWKQLGNPTKVQSFLGLAGYYQRFVNWFSKILAPMTAFTHKNVKFE